MVCSHCVREIPDASNVCPRCGSAQNSGGAAAAVLPGQSTSRFGDLEGDWAGPAPAGEYESSGGAGWEQTGRFAAAYEAEAAPKPRIYTMFRLSGRLNRLKYLYFLLIDSIGGALLYAGLLLSTRGGGISAPHTLAYAAITAILLIPRVFTVVKRLHDINRPGYHVLFLLIPFYNIYIAFRLLLESANDDFNDYGDKEQNGWYWQVPATMLPLPVLYCIAGFMI